MAEGDSILRIAQRIDEVHGGLGGRVGANASRRRPEGRRAEELEGRVLERAESRGKHLLLHFDGPLVLHSHLGMKGAWHIYRRGERWRKPAAMAWLALATETAEAVNFNGTSMRIVREAELARDRRLAAPRPRPAEPGHDDPRPPPPRLRTAGPRPELGDALLNQELLAGIGNIFKSESCWAVKVDPWRSLGERRRRRAGRGCRGGPGPDARGRSQRKAAEAGLRQGPAALPAVPHRDPVPRPGGLGPHDLLVPQLPGLVS